MMGRKLFTIDESWRVVMRDLDVVPADVLRRAALPDDLLSRPDATVDTNGYFRFWAGMEAEAADPLFPIRIAELLTRESFAPPLFAARCSPNYVTAVERFSTYKRLIAPMAIDSDTSAATFTVTVRWLDTITVPPASLAAGELALLVMLMRSATRERVVPLRCQAERLPIPTDAYREFFGVDVVQGDSIQVTFARSDAERPFLTASETMWGVFEPGLRRRLSDLDDAATFSERVRSALLEALPSGRSGMDAVASRLALSRRTLQRRLREEGTTYKQVLGATREELGRHYVTATEISYAEVSFLLGYEDPNSFFRAFHDWTGSTPERLRVSARSTDA